jgi:hypothetical protein
MLHSISFEAIICAWDQYITPAQFQCSITVRSSNQHVPKGMTTFVPDKAALVFQHYSMDIKLHAFLPMALDGGIKSACSGSLTPEEMPILLQDSYK